MFFNHLLEDASIDSAAVHAGLPLNKEFSIGSDAIESIADNGNDSPEIPIEKWVANYWVGLDLDSLEDHMMRLSK